MNINLVCTEYKDSELVTKAVNKSVKFGGEMFNKYMMEVLVYKMLDDSTVIACIKHEYFDLIQNLVDIVYTEYK